MLRLQRIIGFVVLLTIVAGFGAVARCQERVPDVHFVPTPEEVVTEMLNMARVGKNDVVYDLGCGDGRIVITAAKTYGARGVGVDIDPVRIQESKENALKAGVTDHVRFTQQDLFKTDFREATVVFLYLLPELNLELRPKLLRELKPGSRIISHEFNMGDWKPDNSGVVRNVKLYYNPKAPFEKDTYFYYWVVPAEVEGVWQWTLSASGGKEDYLLHLGRKFQEITGEISVKGRKVPITEARLVGDQISFTVKDEANKEGPGMRFNGRIIGDTITGNVEVQGRPVPENFRWTARR
jgi:ubiquinone/menaquinone biosynthesis C-methylase UbiE